MSFSLLALVPVLLAAWSLRLLWKRRHAAPLPPGPRPLPVLGNVLDVPQKEPWLAFTEWGKRYGGLVSLSMMGQPMLVINSYKAAVDLLDKRSSIYSERPKPPSAEYIGYTTVFPLLGIGENFRDQRRMITQTIGTRAQVESFWPLHKHVTHKFLADLLDGPGEFQRHIRKVTGALMLAIAHGHQIQREGEDPLLTLVTRVADQFGEAAMPGAFLVDLFPFLRYFPSWLPGGGWRNKADKFREGLISLREVPTRTVKEKIAKGTANDCFSVRNFQDKRAIEDQDYELQVKCASVALLGGGSETTVATIEAFLLAMVLFPDAQKKAQVELDSVLGGERLPTYHDRDSLPYVNALCTELIRWMPVTPLGIPHSLVQDDLYEGYFLAKGTQILVNQWGMLHDPELYPEPDAFKPERHISTISKPAENDPRDIAFGFGRRTCPGIKAADAVVFAVVASTLAVFNIEKAVENGIPVIPVVSQTNNALSHPIPFKCSIKPRSVAAAALIRSAAVENDAPAL